MQDSVETNMVCRRDPACMVCNRMYDTAMDTYLTLPSSPLVGTQVLRYLPNLPKDCCQFLEGNQRESMQSAACTTPKETVHDEASQTRIKSIQNQTDKNWIE